MWCLSQNFPCNEFDTNHRLITNNISEQLVMWRLSQNFPCSELVSPQTDHHYISEQLALWHLWQHSPFRELVTHQRLITIYISEQLVVRCIWQHSPCSQSITTTSAGLSTFIWQCCSTHKQHLTSTRQNSTESPSLKKQQWSYIMGSGGRGGGGQEKRRVREQL